MFPRQTVVRLLSDEPKVAIHGTEAFTCIRLTCCLHITVCLVRCNVCSKVELSGAFSAECGSAAIWRDCQASAVRLSRRRLIGAFCRHSVLCSAGSVSVNPCDRLPTARIERYHRCLSRTVNLGPLPALNSFKTGSETHTCSEHGCTCVLRWHCLQLSRQHLDCSVP